MFYFYTRICTYLQKVSFSGWDSFYQEGGTVFKSEKTREADKKNEKEEADTALKSITDTDKDGYTVKELAEQYAIDLKITAPEVKNLLQHMKSEFDRLLQERGEAAREVVKESKKQVAQLYLEVIAYQLVNKWKLEKGKFSYEFGKVYFNMTDYSEEVFPKTVADRDIVKNLEALGISMNALVKEANKRHESGDNAAPTVQGREVFPLPPQVQQGETPSDTRDPLSEADNRFHDNSEAEHKAEAEKREQRAQKWKDIDAVIVEEGAYRRAEQFYADYTHAQIVVVQYLIGDPRVAYNGRFDESLYKAVVYYQRQHELVEDGMAGGATMERVLPLNREIRIGNQNYSASIVPDGKKKRFMVEERENRAQESIYTLGLSRESRQALDDAEVRVNDSGILTKKFPNGYEFFMDTRSIPEKLGGPVSHGGVDSPEQVTTVYQLITAMEEHAERYAISKDWIERKYKQGSIEMQALHALFSGHVGSTMEVTPYLYDAIIHEQVKLGFTGKGVDGMPGNDTLSKLIPVQGENLQIAEKRYFVQLKNGKIDVQTVGEAKLNGTTLHVAPMDAYVDRQVQENSYKLLGQYATIIDDSVAIGALQVLLGAERTGVFDTQTIVAVFKKQAQLGYVIPKGENHIGRVLDGTLSSRFLLDAVKGRSVSVENGLCTFAMSHDKLVHYIDGNKENLTSQQLEQNAQVDFYDMFPTELQRWYIQGLLGVQQTGYWTHETYKALQRYAYQHNARLYLTNSQVGNLYGIGGVSGSMLKGNVFVYKGKEYSVHLTGEEDEKAFIEVRGLGNR